MVASLCPLVSLSFFLQKERRERHRGQGRRIQKECGRYLKEREIEFCPRPHLSVPSSLSPVPRPLPRARAGRREKGDIERQGGQGHELESRSGRFQPLFATPPTMSSVPCLLCPRAKETRWREVSRQNIICYSWTTSPSLCPFYLSTLRARGTRDRQGT